jgi:hypothetical protein
MSAALDNLPVNIHSKSLCWLVFSGCESQVMEVQLFHGQLCCMPPLLLQGTTFPLYFIEILLSQTLSSLLNKVVSGSSPLALLKVTLCSLLF